MYKFIKYNPKLKSAARDLRNNLTKQEKSFWDFLRIRFKSFHFARQKPLDQFILDFYCSKLKLIVEIDGEIHNQQKERDKERDSIFRTKYGLNTLRFSNYEVENQINKCRVILEEYIQSREVPPLD